MPTIDLYTIEPGHDALSAFGHSVLCVTSDQSPDGQCYDYGVPDGAHENDSTWLVWDTLRGRPRFVPVAVSHELFQGTFVAQDRTIWRQRLPLSEGEAKAVALALAEDVAAKKAYAYHPHRDNCTTRIRDVIDRATDGRLRAARVGPSDGRTYRDMMDEGFSGKVPELVLLALVTGPESDRLPTTFEGMCLPSRLMGEVEARFDVKPEQVNQRFAPSLPTSPFAGRAVLLVLGLALGLGVRLAARRGPTWLSRSLLGVGAVLGAMALVGDAAAVTSVFTEVSRNWMLLVLVPTDLALGLLSPRWRKRYLVLRLSVLGVLLAASVTGTLSQPLVSLILFPAVPLAAAYLATIREERRRAMPLGGAGNVVEWPKVTAV